MDIITIIYIFLTIAVFINLIVLIYNIIIGELDERILIGTLLIMGGAFSIYILFDAANTFSLLIQDNYNTITTYINNLDLSDSVKNAALSSMQKIYLNYQITNYLTITIYPIIFIAFIIIGLIIITKMDKLIYNKIKEWIENK